MNGVLDDEIRSSRSFWIKTHANHTSPYCPLYLLCSHQVFVTHTFLLYIFSINRLQSRSRHGFRYRSKSVFLVV